MPSPPSSRRRPSRRPGDEKRCDSAARKRAPGSGNNQQENKNMRPLTLASASAALLLVSTGLSQNLIGYNPVGAASVFEEMPLLSPAFGAGGGPGVVRPPFAAPPQAAVAAADGALDVDNTTDIVYSTNGWGVIDRVRYPHLACGIAVALPPLAIPAALAPIKGLAVDPVTKHLFITTGAMLFRVNPMAGMALVCAPWPSAVPLPLSG